MVQIHVQILVTFMTILRLLARQTRLPGATPTRDGTQHGARAVRPPLHAPEFESCAAEKLPTSSMLATCWCVNISTAIQAADAQTILNTASSRMLRVLVYRGHVKCVCVF